MTDLENKSKSLFKKASSDLVAPPFLAARVMNELESRKQNHSASRVWKIAAIGSSFFSICLLVVLLMILSQPKFQSEVGESTLVEVDVRKLTGRDLARMEVDLPDGVSLVSGKYPEISQLRTIALNVPAGSDGDIPLVVRSSERGTKEIKVKLYDSSGREIERKILKIKFT